jgi:alginate export protein
MRTLIHLLAGFHSLDNKVSIAIVMLVLLAGLPAAALDFGSLRDQTAGIPPRSEEDEQVQRSPRVRMGGELFGRFHWNSGSASGGGDQVFALHRTRVNLQFVPRADLRFGFEAQDSRAWTLRGAPRETDPTDVSRAFIEYQPAGGSWTFRVGRQELAFGDERLIGTDDEWCHLAQAFDGARGSFERSGLSIDWFAASPVNHWERRWNRGTGAVQLYGLYTTFDLPDGFGSADAYLLGKVDRHSESEAGMVARGDRYTVGLRHVLDLGAGFESNVEIALQRGSAAGNRVRAWAGHWEIGKQLTADEASPRLSFEYNYSSGDNALNDRVQTQFDDLYPAGHDSYGLPDPVPWSNTHNVGGSLSWSLKPWLAVKTGGRAVWFTALPAALDVSSRFAGWQYSTLATLRPAERWRIDCGYSYLASRLSSLFDAPASIPFVALRYRF